MKSLLILFMAIAFVPIVGTSAVADDGLMFCSIDSTPTPIPISKLKYEWRASTADMFDAVPEDSKSVQLVPDNFVVWNQFSTAQPAVQQNPPNPPPLDRHPPPLNYPAKPVQVPTQVPTQVPQKQVQAPPGAVACATCPAGYAVYNSNSCGQMQGYNYGAYGDSGGFLSKLRPRNWLGKLRPRNWGRGRGGC